MRQLIFGGQGQVGNAVINVRPDWERLNGEERNIARGLEQMGRRKERDLEIKKQIN